MFNHIYTPDHFTDLTSKQKEGKRLYTTPEGIQLPSITTVLGCIEKPWLDDWRNMLGPKKADKETKRASDRGTAVHLMCERYLSNMEIEDVQKGQDLDHIRLFNQIKYALRRRVDNIRGLEVALWSDDLRTAGRTDMIAEYDTIPSIIDFKTSTGVKTEAMIQDYFLQLTAYALMYNEIYKEQIDDIVVIITVEKGFMPMVYKKKVDDYVRPLVERIKYFYTKNQKFMEEVSNANV